MRCLQCGAEIRQDAQICENCGSVYLLLTEREALAGGQRILQIPGLAFPLSVSLRPGLRDGQYLSINNARFVNASGHEQTGTLRITVRVLSTQPMQSQHTRKKRWPLVTAIIAAVVFLSLCVGLLLSRLGNRDDGGTVSDMQAAIEASNVELVPESVVSEISRIDAEFLVDGYIPEDCIDEVVNREMAYAEELFKNGTVTYCERGEDCVYMEFADGGAFLYAPVREDYFSNGAECRIVSLQTALNEEDGLLAMNASNADKAASCIGDAFSAFSFQASDNVDNEKVTIETVLGLAGSKIVIWEGHGAYVEKCHSVLKLQQSYDEVKKDSRYKEDCENNLIVAARNGIWLTAEFFNTHFSEGDFQDAIIYFGACYSASDAYLAETFLSKGAQCVYGNTAAVNKKYEHHIVLDLFQELAKQKTTEEAHIDALYTLGNFVREYTIQDWTDKNNENVLFGNPYYQLRDEITLDLTKDNVRFFTSGTFVEENGELALRLGDAACILCDDGSFLSQTIFLSEEQYAEFSSLYGCYVKGDGWVIYDAALKRPYFKDLKISSFSRRVYYTNCGFAYEFEGTITLNQNGNYFHADHAIDYSTTNGSASSPTVRFSTSDSAKAADYTGGRVRVKGVLRQVNGEPFFEDGVTFERVEEIPTPPPVTAPTPASTMPPTPAPTPETTVNNNWDRLSLSDKIWACGDLMEVIFRKNKDVYDARFLCQEEYEYPPYNEKNRQMLLVWDLGLLFTVNNHWMEELNLAFLLCVDEDLVKILINDPIFTEETVWLNDVYWIYNWDGDLIDQGPGVKGELSDYVPDIINSSAPHSYPSTAPAFDIANYAGIWWDNAETFPEHELIIDTIDGEYIQFHLAAYRLYGYLDQKMTVDESGIGYAFISSGESDDSAEVRFVFDGTSIIMEILSADNSPLSYEVGQTISFFVRAVEPCLLP